MAKPWPVQNGITRMSHAEMAPSIRYATGPARGRAAFLCTPPYRRTRPPAPTPPPRGARQQSEAQTSSASKAKTLNPEVLKHQTVFLRSTAFHPFDKAKRGRIFLITFITRTFRPYTFNCEERLERIMVQSRCVVRQFGSEKKQTVADIARGNWTCPPAKLTKFFPKRAIIQASADRNLVALTRRAVHQHVAASVQAIDRIEKVLLTIYRHTTDIRATKRQVFKLMTGHRNQKGGLRRGIRQVLLQTLAKIVKEGMSTANSNRG